MKKFVDFDCFVHLTALALPFDSYKRLKVEEIVISTKSGAKGCVLCA